jgi:hypothetical protein
MASEGFQRARVAASIRRKMYLAQWYIRQASIFDEAHDVQQMLGGGEPAVDVGDERLPVEQAHDMDYEDAGVDVEGSRPAVEEQPMEECYSHSGEEEEEEEVEGSHDVGDVDTEYADAQISSEEEEEQEGEQEEEEQEDEEEEEVEDDGGSPQFVDAEGNPDTGTAKRMTQLLGM